MNEIAGPSVHSKLVYYSGNLQIKDTPFCQRLSSSRRSRNVLLLWEMIIFGYYQLSFLERLYSTQRVLCQRFHCISIVWVHSPSFTGKPAGSFMSTNCLSLLKCLYGATTSRISKSLRSNNFMCLYHGY